MTTIHIHLTDAAYIADIVNYALMHGGDPTIRIDQDEPATRVATSGFYFDAPNYDSYEHAIQRAEERIHRFQIDEMEYDRVISLDCPFCGAVAGKPCHTASGATKPRPVTHAARKAAYGEYETATRAATRTLDAIDAQIASRDCHPAVASIVIPLDEM